MIPSNKEIEQASDALANVFKRLDPVKADFFGGVIIANIIRIILAKNPDITLDEYINSLKLNVKVCELIGDIKSITPRRGRA